jgi:pimeloyl-ACP methyl ester carboxylesterase
MTSLRTETLTNGVTVTLTDRGAGPAVLVLHGGGGPLSVARFVEAMSATHRVLAPTQPGFGGTPRPEWLMKIGDVAQTYSELLERYELQEVLVIGFSMGGWVASELATRAKGRLRGVILVDGAGGIQVEGHRVANVFGLTPQQLSALSYHDPVTNGIDPSKMAPEQLAAMAANFKALAIYLRDQESQDPTLRARLAKVEEPALVIWGDSDRIISCEYSQDYANAFPHGRLEVIEKCGHLPQVEQPARLMALICKFEAQLSELR